LMQKKKYVFSSRVFEALIVIAVLAVIFACGALRAGKSLIRIPITNGAGNRGPGIAPPPISIDYVTLRVSGPDLAAIDKVFMADELAAAGWTLSAEVPSGNARTVSVIVTLNTDSTSNPGSILEYTGSATADLPEGETATLVIKMKVTGMRLIVPDASNVRMVRFNGWSGETVDYYSLVAADLSLSYFNPYDVDFDSMGRCYFANNWAGSGVVRFDELVPSASPTILNGTSSLTTCVAVDDVNGYVYSLAINPSNYSIEIIRSTLDGLNQVSSPLGSDINSVTAFDVDDQGFLYVVGSGWTVLPGPSPSPILSDGIFKCTLDPGKGLIVNAKRFYLEHQTEMGYSMTDITVRGGNIYVANPNGPDGCKILEYDPGLSTLLASYGKAFSGTLPFTVGEFYYPVRFIPFQKELTIIDDDNGGNNNKIVFLSDLTDSGWSTFPEDTMNTGQSYFQFFFNNF
jgi:hypothetical protein